MWVFFLAPALSIAQAPAYGASTPPQDSVELRYYYPDAPEQTYAVSDTGMDFFNQFDPVRQQPVEWLNLGNLGTAHRRLYFQPVYRRGIVAGQSQFDLYRILPDSLAYYQLGQAYSDAFFSQGGSQEDGYFRGKFNRNFGPQVNLTAHYKRLNQTGTRTNFKYANLRAQNTALAVGFRFRSADRRYDGFLSYHFDIIRQENNGGVQNPGQLEQPDFPGAFAAAVKLSNSITRHDHRSFNLTQYYHLISADTAELRLSLKHRAAYRLHRYKTTDELGAPSSQDSAFYGPLLTDSRGLRYFLEMRELTNHFSVLFGRKAQQLEAGLWHTFYTIDEEDERSNPQNLYLTGRLQLSTGENLRLDARAQLGLLERQAGDYRLHGRLFVGDFLSVELINQLYAPTLTEERILISGREVWNTDFSKTLSNTIQGELRVPALNLSLQGGYHLLNNWVYFDEENLPQQESGTVNLLQAMLKHRLQVLTIQLHNTVVYQQVEGPDVLRLPPLFTEHNLFGDVLLFKRRLRLRLGADLRLYSGYFPDAYQPLTGQFHLQNQREEPLAAALDVYAAFQVATFRFFFSSGNIMNPLNDELVFPAHDYPLLQGNTRFGIRWVLRD